MAALSGALAPALFGTSSAARLKAAGRGLLSHCRYARDLAVRHNTLARVELDEAANAHRVVEYQVADGQTEPQWQPVAGALGTWRALPEGVRFARGVARTEQGARAVTFAPDGSGEDWFMLLADTQDRRLAVHVTAATGASELLAPDDGEVFAALEREAEAPP